MRTGIFTYLLIVLMVQLLLGENTPVFAQIADTPNTPPIIRVSQSTYQIGKILLDVEKREVRFPGKVNMAKGVIELLACAPGGKRHESILIVYIIPYHLQVSLLLLGLNYGDNINYQGDPTIPQGDSVEVWVKWNRNNEEFIVRGEDFIFDLVSRKTMKHTHWIFSGSKVINGTFMADMEGSIITTFHDPYTIIDNPLPGGGNDELYVVNETLVPPKETEIQLIIKAVSNKE
jgi:hypothetical protein